MNKFFNIESFIKMMIAGLVAVIVYQAVDYLYIKAQKNAVTSFIVNAKVEKSDKFQLFFKEVSDKKFSEKKSYKKKLEGSLTSQSIKFEIPDSLNVSEVRLDIGQNRNQAPIVINSIVISKRGNVFEIPAARLAYYFKPNYFIEPDWTRTTFTTKVNRKGSYDPYFKSIDLSDTFQKLGKVEKVNTLPLLACIIIGLCFFVFLVIEKISFSYKFSNILLVVCFLGLLLLPTLDNLFSLDASPSTEKRELLSKPELNSENLSEFSSDYEAYFKENFGFRNLLIKKISQFKINYLNVSNVPNKAVFGKEGWIFLYGDTYKVESNFTRKDLLSVQELNNVKENWEKRKEKLEVSEIKYYKIFYPNKHTIYPEFLPYRIKIQQRDTLSKVDQIITFLKDQKSPMHVIDIRDALLEEKEKNQIYYKHDSHWNSLGAFIGYRELFKVISADFPHIQPKTLKDFDLSWKLEKGGDLINILGIDNNNEQFKELKPHLKLKVPNNIKRKKTAGLKLPARSIIHVNSKSGNELKVLVFRDSYSSALMSYFSVHFSEATYIWTKYNQDLVDRLQPDIVIDGHVERYFGP